MTDGKEKADSIEHLNWSSTCDFQGCGDTAIFWVDFHGCNNGILCAGHRDFGVAEIRTELGKGNRIRCIYCPKVFITLGGIVSFKAL